MATSKKSKKSPIILQAEDLEKKDSSYAMSETERTQYELIAQRLDHARTQRDMARDEWDGQTYNQYYQTNQRAAMSYLAPKTNNDDARVNTGTTEKKVEYVMNQILSLNLTGEILAFDEDDNLMDKLSDALTSVVHRTEQMEEADDKDLFIYTELLSQPCAFVEELWVEKQVRNQQGKMITVKRCERQLLQGPQVYLGDINIPDYRFNDQPFIFKYFRMTYDEAKTIYGDWDNWSFIKPGSYQNLTPVPYQIYRKNSLLANEIEGFIYMCSGDNEYQIILQGIPMLPVGTNLPWDWEGYNIVCVGLKPFHGDFAYGKSLVAAAKTLQALDNEMIRNFVRKTRQSIEPPTGVPLGKVYSRDIWSPGSMVQGVTAATFSPLITHTGVTQSEMNMFDVVQQKINEFVGTDSMAALSSGSRISAQTVVALQKIALQMIGLAIIAATRLESKLAMMRAKNILSNYTKASGKQVNPITQKIENVYAQFSLNNTDLADGSTGTKTIKFMENPMSEPQQWATNAQATDLKNKGNPTDFIGISTSILKDLNLNFYATAVSKPKDSRELEKSMFTDELGQAAQITQMTGRPLNADAVTKKFERIWNDKDLFEKQAPPQQAQPGQPAPPQSGATGGNPTPPTPNVPTPNVPNPANSQTLAPQPVRRPTVNTMLHG